jgi:hypothetical protein
MDLLEETIACTMANASGVTAMVMQLLVTHSHYAVEAVNTIRKVKIVKNVHLASMEIR